MKPEDVKCPECGGMMLRRRNRRDGSAFWGCARFPDCRGTLDASAEPRGPGREDDDPGDPGDELPSDRLRRADRARWRD